jgi:hypothetical protein
MASKSIFLLVISALLCLKVVVGGGRHIYDGTEQKTAVTFLFGQKVEELADSLHHINKSLDKTWKIQVFYQGRSPVDILHGPTGVVSLSNPNGTARFYDPKRFVFTDAGTESYHDLRTLNTFMVKNTTFWHAIDGERMLFFQSESTVCSTTSPYFPDLFMAFDYVGVPWRHKYATEHFVRTGNLNVSFSESNSNNEYHGGNGAFSIRSKRSMLACSIAANDGSLAYKKGFPEDIWFSHCVINHLKDMKLPPRKVQLAFAVEAVIERPNQHVSTFGVHKAWVHADEKQWTKIVTLCPEAAFAKKIHDVYGDNKLRSTNKTEEAKSAVSKAHRYLLEVMPDLDHVGDEKIAVPEFVHISHSM